MKLINQSRLIPKFDGMIENGWVTETGEVILLDQQYDHGKKVAELFPNQSNPEKYVEDLGWIKISGGAILLNRYGSINQSQINALFDRIDPDEFKTLLSMLQ